jgi:hypothetical protein
MYRIREEGREERERGEGGNIRCHFSHKLHNVSQKDRKTQPGPTSPQMHYL